ncbi:FAD-binding oxidoreductase [Brevibacterium aurantiacum]|uniref:FAD-dependent oxidoreductase n=1 Tax=Brevibacterium aurantiacum TaxID=273384 RepID=A0A556CAR5_BREAU|nr:FAD-dependent oxidoreductase [Brevibacterium aurantiacum]TSI14490.1 FAD-dependent oxidoreductase [Brevibacterium aurantiacum]
MPNSGTTVLVVGAGAWGLPAALRLQDLGHHVTLIDRFEPNSPYASNGGTTRLWRLVDTHAWRMRAIMQTLPTLERLEQRVGRKIFEHTGLLWRDNLALENTMQALETVDQPYTYVEASAVSDFFPGLIPDGRNALYVDEAGVVFADQLLNGCLRAFLAAGGVFEPHTRVTAIDPRSSSVTVSTDNGRRFTADQLLLAAGPGTKDLLPGLDFELPLRAYIEQVVYFAPETPGKMPIPLPSIVDCAVGNGPGLYAMPDRSGAYKAGTDHPLRSLVNGSLGNDLDRRSDDDRTRSIATRVGRDLTTVPRHIVGTQVCTWTDTSDGNFITGRTHPTVVLACGDCGEGFKFAAFMGEYLADLVESSEPDDEYHVRWNPLRFGSQTSPPDEVVSLGRR